MSLRLFLQIVSLELRTALSYRADFWLSALGGIGLELLLFVFIAQQMARWEVSGDDPDQPALVNVALHSHLPPTRRFGVRCPGCGLTRSLVHFADGDLRSSYELHRLGWLFGVLVLLQFPYRAIALLGRNWHPIGKRAPQIIGAVLIALLIGSWLLEVSS